MLALIPLLFTAHTALAAATVPGISLLARQSITPDASCVSACTALENVVTAADTSLSALCTSQVVGDYATCYNCVIASGSVTQASAQSDMDDYVSGCAAAGFPVSGVTLSGGGSTGGGTIGSGGTLGSGTSTTVRASETAKATATNTGFSSSSTGSSTGSSSGDAGSSSGGDTGTSSSDGDSSSSSSSSTGSSSSDGDSSSSSSGSGSGLGSGSGFKTSGSVRTGPAAVFLAVLSVAIFTML